MRASGATEDQIAAAQKASAAIYAIVKRESDPAVIRDQAGKVALDAIDTNPSLSDAQKADAKKAVDAEIGTIASPWYRTFLSIDPAAYLSKVTVPVLALNGSLDLQVPADEDLAGIDVALKAAGSTRYRIVKLEGLNHLFQHAQTGLPDEYGKITETFSPDALALIRDFVSSIR
jgi:fermentation-respiration switch protein FrsA (DUF1100 family)